MLVSNARRWKMNVGVVATFAVSLMAVACSSSSTGGATGDDAGGTDGAMATTAAQACVAQASAICTLRNTCSMTYSIEKNYPDIATCELRTAQTCVNASTSSGTAATAASITACAAAYPSEACGDYFDGNPVAACVPPAGTLQTGAACGASSQCMTTFCAVSQYQVCGTCQPLPQAGATCQVDADCGRDLVCGLATGATTGTCLAYAASGGACLTGTAPCGAGLGCVGDDVAMMTKGTCMTQGATVGASCDGSRKTAANCSSEIGLTCIPTAAGSSVGACQTISLVSVGMPCGDVGAAPITGFAACEAGGLCAKASATATTGTCVAAATDGAACDSNPIVGPPCLAPAKCVTSSDAGTAGICTVPNASTCM